MVYPLGVDVFSRKKHEKELQKAARCAVIFMCNVSTNNLRACEAFWHREVQLFDGISPRRRCFLSQKARKGAAKSRAMRGCFLCGNDSANNLRACEAFWHREVQLFDGISPRRRCFSLAKSTKRSSKKPRGARLFCNAGEGLILSQSGWHTKPAGAGCFFNADERFIISQSSVLSSTQACAGRGYFLCGNVCTNIFRTQNWGAFWAHKKQDELKKNAFCWLSVDYRVLNELINLVCSFIIYKFAFS